RRRRFPTVLRLMTPYPRRVLAHEWGKPSKAKLPVPLADGPRRGGGLNATTAVFSGGMVRRKRAHRFGKTALTRRASASHAQPLIKSAAQRVRKPRPCIPGGPSLTNPSAQTRGRSEERRV